MHRRPPSPESPQPYRETEHKETTFLPPVEPGTVAVTLDALPAYIREHNKSGKSKLHVVSPKKGRKLECPIVLRFTAPNVVTVYLTLDCSAQDGQTLIVENATAIGSREQVRLVICSVKIALTDGFTSETAAFSVGFHGIPTIVPAACEGYSL